MKFKKGDRVLIAKKCKFFGDTGQIVGYLDGVSFPYEVKLDNNKRHYYFKEDEMTLVNETGKRLVGDITNGYRYVDYEKFEAQMNKIDDVIEKTESSSELTQAYKLALNSFYGLPSANYLTPTNVDYTKFVDGNMYKEALEYLKQINESKKKKGAIAMRYAYIKNVIFNNPATIVFWSDGTKTVVKCSENDIYDPEKGLALAIVKKSVGNESAPFHRVFKDWMPKETNLDE